MSNFGKMGYKVPLIPNKQELAQVVKIIGDDQNEYQIRITNKHIYSRCLVNIERM
jgi:hypothetical protein